MTLSSPVHRIGFGLKKEVEAVLARDYYSPVVSRIQASGNTLVHGRLTIRLADEFGFCYGVDKAVDFAYETRKKFPGKKIFLTTEIIHNPMVNNRLKEMGIRFIEGQHRTGHGFESITAQDIVILPAFGIPIAELEELKKKGCILVETTCGSVINVWKRVEKYAKEGYTAVIHGKFAHEETRATCSRVGQQPHGCYLVVRDKIQAQKVIDYILGGGEKDTIFKEFQPAISPGFDPDKDLERVGLANQTTMLSSESMEIAQMFKKAMAKKYGANHVQEHFQNFDTICSATQDRQDAVLKLLKNGVDLMIVIGGYNSSNTQHLCEIAKAKVATYHIQEARDILSSQKISHCCPGAHQIITTENWLGEGHKTIGVTAGASTPNRVIGEVVEKILACQ